MARLIQPLDASLLTLSENPKRDKTSPEGRFPKIFGHANERHGRFAVDRRFTQPSGASTTATRIDRGERLIDHIYKSFWIFRVRRARAGLGYDG